MIANMLLATVALAAAPTIRFTEDSVYKKDRIISVSVVENVDDGGDVESKTLLIDPNYVLGYEIYDVPETSEIEGLRLDGAPVYEWRVEGFDDTLEHVIDVRTVYTDDLAGSMMAAKDGDWSRLMSNPLIVLQFVYYGIAAVSTLVGFGGLAASRRKKIKSADQIAALVSGKAEESMAALTAYANKAIDDLKAEYDAKLSDIVNGAVIPTMERLKTQYQSIMEAMILTKSGDKESTLALIELIRKSATEDPKEIAEKVRCEIERLDAERKKARAEAAETVAKIAEGKAPVRQKPELEDDGTSI